MNRPTLFAFALVSMFAAPALRAGDALGAATIKKIDAMCEPLVDAKYAVGFVVGTLKDGQTWTKGYGEFEKGKGVAPDADTLFEIGSISKTFTGLLLADAVQRKLCTFDEPMSKLLPPEAKWTDDDPPILLKHLTTHSSGLPRMPTNFAPKDPDDPYADYDDAHLYAFLAGVADSPLPRAPGDQYEYSNLAVGLLGQLMVRANGAKNYEQLLHDRITGPLGLHDTMITIPKELEARFTPSYDADLRLVHHWTLNALSGAGAIRSTVNDLLKFARLQIDPSGTPLEDAIDASHTILYPLPKPNPSAKGVACGWHVSSIDALWHNGQVGGHHGFVAFDPKRRVAAVILCNSACPQIDGLADAIFLSLMGMEKAPPPIQIPVPVDRKVLERYVGTYKLNLLAKFTIGLDEEGLTAQLTGQPAFHVFAQSQTKFAYRVVDATIDFEVDANGETKALVLHQNGADQRAEKE